MFELIFIIYPDAHLKRHSRPRRPDPNVQQLHQLGPPCNSALGHLGELPGVQNRIPGAIQNAPVNIVNRARNNNHIQKF